MNKAIIRTFQAVFTIAILIWLFHSPEKRAQMAYAIARADSTWLWIGLPVALTGEVANIIRWQILMRVQGMYMSWRRAIMLFFVGLFFNLFMPGYTGGDFARLYFLMREFPDKKKEAIFTVVMDRLIGMGALVLTAVVTTTLRWSWLQRTPKATVLLWVLIAMVIGFVIATLGSFAITGFLLNRLPIPISRSFGRDLGSLSSVREGQEIPLIRIFTLVPCLILVLRSFLLYSTSVAGARICIGHGLDHADRNLDHFVAGHTRRYRFSRIAAANPAAGFVWRTESSWSFDFAPRFRVLRAFWYCRWNNLFILRSETAPPLARNAR
jgi:uncharacterized membrane protein YbhN (UPF0104 family)